MLNNTPDIYLVSDLLGLPGYFYCHRTRCTLREKICVKRQQVNEASLHRNDSVPFPICLDCDKGQRMKQRFE